MLAFPLVSTSVSSERLGLNLTAQMEKYQQQMKISIEGLIQKPKALQDYKTTSHVIIPYGTTSLILVKPQVTVANI